MDLELIKSIIEPRLNELGYELYSLKNRREGKDIILEVIVDRVSPINMDDILNVTNEINTLLDEKDPIEEAYVLDISSLGAEKPLKVGNLKDYIGSYIHLHMINPVDGYNIIEGELESVDENTLSLSYRVKTRVKHLSCELKNIYKIRLAIKF